MDFKNELYALNKQLHIYVDMYTENMKTEKSDYMKAYFQGKLDGFTMAHLLLDTLIKRGEEYEADMLRDMQNRFDNENEVEK